MSYAGSCLSRDEWNRSLETALAEQKRWIDEQMHSKSPFPKWEPGLEQRAVKALQDIARLDRAYAWWSAHQLKLLGSIVLSNDPPFLKLPETLTDQINQTKEPK